MKVKVVITILRNDQEDKTLDRTWRRGLLREGQWRNKLLTPLFNKIEVANEF